MAVLLILGNTNKYTFVNSIVAANEKSKRLFNLPLQDIYIIHSQDSKIELSENRDWVEYLYEKHHIKPSVFTERIIDIGTSKDTIIELSDYIENSLQSFISENRLLIDLSNGTTVVKNILSVVAFVLDIKYQYMIDTVNLFKSTEKRDYIDSETLIKFYIAAPNSVDLDKIAYLNLSEITRFKSMLKILVDNIDKNELDIDTVFFVENLLEALNQKFNADKKKSNAAYRIASSSVPSSIEEFLDGIIRRYDIKIGSRFTLGQKINKIQQIIENIINHRKNKEFDKDFFVNFNSFILNLRNSTTHKKGYLSEIEKIKANLSYRMIFLFVEYYLNIIIPLLEEKNNLIIKDKFQKISRDGNSDVLYYGLDGDDTGKYLEKLFIEVGDVLKLKNASKDIKLAVEKISKMVKDNRGEVIYSAGDDILFKGKFNYRFIEELQKKYYDITKQTCSVGYGESIKDVFIALKIAKSHPGKNKIYGLKFN